jgi:hypothetical protein
MAMRSLEHGLRPLQSMEARRRGHNRERGTRGTRLGPYRGSGGGKVARQQSEMAAVVGLGRVGVAASGVRKGGWG